MIYFSRLGLKFREAFGRDGNISLPEIYGRPFNLPPFPPIPSSRRIYYG
jgi:hypothetical protein